MNVEPAPDIQALVEHVIDSVPFTYVKTGNIVCMRSYKSTSRARARIWSFPKIWQMALHIDPHYIIEVVSEHFDHLSSDDKIRVLIHELMHIPKNFSGALIPHRGIHKKINSRSVEQIFATYKTNRFRT